MRRYSLFLLLGIIVALGGIWASPTAADPPAAGNPKVEAAPADWRSDPVCQMVFFAVLEGLYRDGVSTEAAQSVTGRKGRAAAGDLKQTFVTMCPLCHPVYEAFCLYQQRPVFSGFKGDPDTFGKGLEPGLEIQLKSANLITRQRALQTVVTRWVEQRLGLMRLTEKEKEEWASKLKQRSEEGITLLTRLRGSDPVYKLWSGYGTCPSCKGVQQACGVLRLGR